MNANLAGHAHLVHHGGVGHLWKLWIAGTVVALLTGCGLYLGVPQWMQGEIETGLFFFGWLATAAVTYAFGYFWCLPEVLGAISHDESRSLRQKWSDFALLSCFIAILFICGSYAQVIWENYSVVSLSRGVPIILACSWLLPACVVASLKYLGWTMPEGEARSSAGWKARIRNVMRGWGNALVAPLRPRVALGIGGALLVSTLVLVTYSDIFAPEYKGYEVALGSGNWPLVNEHDFLARMLAQTHRGAYILAVFVGVLAIAGALAGRWGSRLRKSRLLGALVGTIALLQITSLAAGMAAGLTHGWIIPIAFLIVSLAVPITLWLRFPRTDLEAWNHVRVATLVFYLPWFFLAVAILPFFTYMALGYGAFIAGGFFVWWGLVQSSRPESAT